MSANSIAINAQKFLHKTGFKLKKHSPEIMIVAGIVGVVTSAVMACKATLEVGNVLDDAQDKIDNVHDNLTLAINSSDDAEEYTEEQSKKDLALVYIQTGVQMAKLYGPAVILGALSITSIVASNNVLRKRNVALAAAYAGLDQSFKNYRNRVVERFGKDVDHQLECAITPKQIVEETIGEDGKKKKTKSTIDVCDPNGISQYARIFDETNLNWEKDPEYNLQFLTAQQNHANDKLRAYGYLYLNDVYDMLGFPKSKAGQVVGWLYNEKNPTGDNYVDFGIYNINRQKCNDFVNGYERSILLDFNVDGNIWTSMDV